MKNGGSVVEMPLRITAGFRTPRSFTDSKESNASDDDPFTKITNLASSPAEDEVDVADSDDPGDARVHDIVKLSAKAAGAGTRWRGGSLSAESITPRSF